LHGVEVGLLADGPELLSLLLDSLLHGILLALLFLLTTMKLKNINMKLGLSHAKSCSTSKEMFSIPLSVESTFKGRERSN